MNVCEDPNIYAPPHTLIPPTRATCASWSKDGRVVVFTDGGAGIYASRYLEETKDDQHLRYHSLCKKDAVTVTDLQLSHDLAWVVCGCSDGSLRLLHLTTEQVDKLDAPHQLGTPIKMVRFNRFSSSVASVSADGMISVTKTQHPRGGTSSASALVLQAPLETNPVTCLEFSAIKPETLATGDLSGMVTIWETR